MFHCKLDLLVASTNQETKSVTALIIRRLPAGCSTSYPSDQPLNVKIIFGFRAIVFYIVKEKCIYLNIKYSIF